MNRTIERSGFIGSSDISAVMSMNPWKSPLQLWAEKTGAIEQKDLSDNEAVEWGTRLERIVSEKFSDKNGVKLMAYKKRFIHPDYDFLSCELDNIIVGTDEMVEIKTANMWAYKEWANPDEIPAHYICQVMFALGLSKRRIGHIAVLVGGQKYLEKKIQFDQEMFDVMVKRAVDFWQCVQNGTPPAATGMDNETIAEVYTSTDEEIQDAEELNDQIALLQEIKMHISELDLQKDNIEASLKQRIGEHLGIKTSKYTLTWKPQHTARVDVQKLKDAKLYDQFLTTIKTRVLRVKKEKENV